MTVVLVVVLVVEVVVGVVEVAVMEMVVLVVVGVAVVVVGGRVVVVLVKGPVAVVVVGWTVVDVLGIVVVDDPAHWTARMSFRMALPSSASSPRVVWPIWRRPVRETTRKLNSIIHRTAWCTCSRPLCIRPSAQSISAICLRIVAFSSCRRSNALTWPMSLAAFT
jgi:hypothetical protein